MPFIQVKTNQTISADSANAIKTKLGSAITAIPGKSEAWLMVGLEGDYPLYFKGTDQPAAMVTVQIYGSASENALNTLTAHITGILSDALAIPSDRIYVSFWGTEHWGWNGSNL